MSATLSTFLDRPPNLPLAPSASKQAKAPNLKWPGALSPKASSSAAPLEPPKILPSLPNVVQFQQMTAPARPRLQISQETLSKLRPREVRKVKLTTEPAPDLPTLDQKLADIAPSMLPHAAPARPKLELNAGGAPRVAQRAQTGEVEPAPEVGSAQSGVTNGNAATFIALSASPAPPAPVVA